MKEGKDMISKINGNGEDNFLVINKGREDDCQVVVQEQKESNPSSPGGNHDLAITKQETGAIKTNNTTDPSTSETNKDHTSPSILKNKQEDELKLANFKANMGEVREENERLKVLLARTMTEYQSLQLQFSDILRHQEAKSRPSDCKSLDDLHQSARHDDDQLVSLSLGRSSSPIGNESRKDEMTIKKTKSGGSGKDHDHERLNDGDQPALGLGSLSETTKNSNSDNSFDDKDQKGLDDQDVQPIEMWPPSKVLKMARSSGTEDHTNNDDEVSQTSPLKKARVSIRARCDTPTMNDGCQWRKYGQKIAKGNPCPRAYYRCTVSPICPVKKQVQRCVEDMSILITTYEGTHNHPLPISAIPMASTTSAAASMLRSHSTASTSSQPGLLLSSAISGPISTVTSSNPTLPLGLNLSTITAPTATTITLFQNSLIRSSPQQHQQFYSPNTSISISNNPHPTVTLDLTFPCPYSSHIHEKGSLSLNTSSMPKSYPSTCLNLSLSSSSSSSLERIINNHHNGYFNFRDYPIGSNGNYNKQPLIQESTFYQPHLNNINNNNNNNNNNHHHHHQISTTLTNQQSLTETIAAATNAITSNPNFKSALAAALTSFVGNGGP